MSMEAGQSVILIPLTNFPTTCPESALNEGGMDLKHLELFVFAFFPTILCCRLKTLTGTRSEEGS